MEEEETEKIEAEKDEQKGGEVKREGREDEKEKGNLTREMMSSKKLLAGRQPGKVSP